MKHLGAYDAKVTQYSGDGGVDVESRCFIAPVKTGSSDLRVGW
jgi:hypothetical protein